MGKRKIEMMRLSYFFTGVVTIVYLAVCAYTKTPPSDTAMMIMFGSVGVGHGSANWANGQEHKAKTE